MRAAILLLVALAVPALSQIKREQDPASAISGTAISPSTVTVSGTGYSIQATNGSLYAKYGVAASSVVVTNSTNGFESFKVAYGAGISAALGVNASGAGYCPAIFQHGTIQASFCDQGLALGNYSTTTNPPADSLIVSGGVGVGDATPTQTLDVTGTIGISDVQAVALTGGNFIFGNPAGGGTQGVYLAAGGDYGLAMTSARLIGIGTTSPATKLHMSSGTLTVDGDTALSLNVNGNASIGGRAANNGLILDSASGFTQIIIRRGGTNKWTLNNNVDGTDFFNIQNETGGFSAAALTPAGLFRPRIRTAAQIHAITPDILGGIVVCSDCTRPYTICVATGTASADQFREQGETTGCY